VVPVPAGIRARDGEDVAEWSCASGASDRGIPTGGAAAAALGFAAGDLAVAAEVSVCPDPSDRLMAVLIFFGVEEDGAGTGDATFGGTDVAEGETEDGGVGGVVASAATADPKALGGEALGSGEIVPVFGGS
jgi:hypothetical protein